MSAAHGLALLATSPPTDSVWIFHMYLREAVTSPPTSSFVRHRPLRRSIGVGAGGASASSPDDGMDGSNNQGAGRRLKAAADCTNEELLSRGSKFSRLEDGVAESDL